MCTYIHFFYHKYSQNVNMYPNVLEMYTEYTGEEFNLYHKSLCKEIKFYKFLNNDLKHHGFTYEKGLNVDTKTFNPTGDCSSGGLYFCEESKTGLYFEEYGTKLALIEIPDDARVYVEKHKFKADKLIIRSIMDFNDVEDEFWINIIPKDGCALEYVKNQTDNICISAVQQNGNALQYVKNQTNNICISAVQQNGYAIQFIKNPSETLCKLAVMESGYVLTYIKEQQTEDICKLAIQRYSDALRFVKEQTDDICKLAVKKDGLLLQYVKNQTTEICKLAIQQNSHALQYVKEQTLELCILAVQQNSHALQYVKKQFKTESNLLKICKSVDSLSSYPKHDQFPNIICQDEKILLVTAPIKMVSSGIPKLNKYCSDAENDAKRIYLYIPKSGTDPNSVELFDCGQKIDEYLNNSISQKVEITHSKLDRSTT